MEELTRVFVTTYTSMSHLGLIGLLSSMDVQYRYDQHQTEQIYSKFELLCNYAVLEKLKDLSDANNATPISLEYGR